MVKEFEGVNDASRDVKLVTGKSEEQKTRLAEEIVKDVTSILNYGAELCRSRRKFKPEDWAEKVYRGEIVANPERT